MNHTYLFRSDHWQAEGTYYDEAGHAFPLTGRSEILCTEQQWMLNGLLVVHLPIPIQFTNHYQIQKSEPPATLVWQSHNPALGNLSGTFEIVGAHILSQYRSTDHVYSGFEVLTLQADGTYQNTGLSLKAGKRLSAWTAVLLPESERKTEFYV